MKWHYIAAVVLFVVGFIILGTKDADALRCKVDSPCDPDAGHHKPTGQLVCFDGDCFYVENVIKPQGDKHHHKPKHHRVKYALPHTGA